MNILFSMRHAGAIRNFLSTIRGLAERGHHIHLAFVMPDRLGAESSLWDLTADYPNITHTDPASKRASRFWLLMARGVRLWADYLRYLGPEYRDADKLRERAADRLPQFLIRFSSLRLVNSPRGRRRLAAVLRAIEQALPTDRWVNAIIAEQQPDIVLVTPLVDLGSEQVDYVKSARAQGVRTGLCVHSWDNLTNKGLIRIPPDRVYVWNEVQKQEAVEMHGLQPEQVVVTGAPAYDQWFARIPSTTRQAFCTKVGLPTDRPFIVYLCSSGVHRARRGGVHPSLGAGAARTARRRHRVRSQCIHPGASTPPESATVAQVRLRPVRERRHLAGKRRESDRRRLPERIL